MPEWNIDGSVIVNIVVQAAAIVGGLAVLFQKLIKPGLERMIKSAVEPLLPRLIMDSTGRIETKLDDMARRLDRHSEKLDDVKRQIEDHKDWSADVMQHNRLIDPHNSPDEGETDD